MSGIGHNNGPSMEAGAGFRKLAWSKARADLIPTLPIEILRRRVTRAKELGLPYKAYASVRASTGRDVIGFLFSNNALRVIAPVDLVPVARAEQLGGIKDAALVAASHAPLAPRVLAEQLLTRGIRLDASFAAPRFTDSWSGMAEKISAPLRAAKLPKDGVLVIGDTAQEALWSEAAKLAGFLPSDQYFTAATQGR